MDEEYWPITLLSCIGKVFEHVLHEDIASHLNINHPLHKAQYRFHRCIGTEDSVRKSLQLIAECKPL
jgi:hypothetical protein